MRALVPLVLAVACLMALPPAGSVALPGAGPCPVPDFIQGTQLVTAAGGEWLRVTFTTDHTFTSTFWAEVGAAFSPTGGFYGFFSERAMAAAFVEDSAGNNLLTPGFSLYPYGIELDAGANVLRLGAGDLGGCEAAAAGGDLTLGPGTYRVVVLGATETHSGTGAVLPRDVVATRVERGPLQPVSESGFACQVNVRAEAEGFSSEVLQACSTPYPGAGRVYRALTVGHFPDAQHNVHWVAPDGSTRNVVFFDLATGAPGTWHLDIPTYITPIGQPTLLPLPNDGGVFGAFAGLP
ncbi:MAG: hypothetical protein LC624_01095 [Halobacteriales archaeon]|nr:hypothetical protein [Halobacteriales archaeon]